MVRVEEHSGMPTLGMFSSTRCMLGLSLLVHPHDSSVRRSSSPLAGEEAEAPYA